MSTTLTTAPLVALLALLTDIAPLSSISYESAGAFCPFFEPVYLIKKSRYD